ncbi:MAG: NADH-quinone oxidoreductase subunit C [Sediminispirochaetaceae bacterium]
MVEEKKAEEIKGKEMISENLHHTLESIPRRYRVTDIEMQGEKGDLGFITVPAEMLKDLLGELKEKMGFTHLVFLTAVDFIEEGQFQLVYMLHNYHLHGDVGVRVFIPREDSEMESIHHLWAQAATYQRELREMYGIRFPGSPRLYEAFALEGWEDIPPMRREFDTKRYSEETYFPRPGRETHDPADYMRKKLYPEEM